MENNIEDLNRFRIIRKDARCCFVETKSDSFGIGKAHLEFATYDVSRPEGQRQTNHVNIYIDMPEFLHLTHESLSGTLHMRAEQMKEKNDNSPLYEHFGGTSVLRLTRSGKARADGKSLSRIFKLIRGRKADYLLVADSGPGEADAKGLIVPGFGNAPENHVSVSMNRYNLNELLLMTKTHFEAWLAAQYVNMPDFRRPTDENGRI